MARNNRGKSKAKDTQVEVQEIKETVSSEEVLTEEVLTDSQLAQKYGYDEHTWEGTVSIWKKKKELGIK